MSTPAASRTTTMTQTSRSGACPTGGLKMIQEQVGHAYASTTAIYTSVSNDFKNKTLQAALKRVYAPNGKEDQ